MRKLVTSGIIIVGGAVAAVLLGPNGPLGGFWRPVGVDLEPTGWQLVSLLGSGLVEALGVGLALATLSVGRPLFIRLTTPTRATAAQLACAWLLGSWWPHTALHMHFGAKASALAGIEPVFHAGSIIVACVLIWALIPGALRHAVDPESPRRTAAVTEPPRTAT